MRAEIAQRAARIAETPAIIGVRSAPRLIVEATRFQQFAKHGVLNQLARVNVRRNATVDEVHRVEQLRLRRRRVDHLVRFFDRYRKRLLTEDVLASRERLQYGVAMHRVR